MQMSDCNHDHNFEFEGDEVFTQLENLIRLTRLVRCNKCGQLGMDVYVYIGTYPADEKLFKSGDEEDKR